MIICYCKTSTNKTVLIILVIIISRNVRITYLKLDKSTFKIIY